MTLLAGRYELRDTLGTGATGRVVVAHDRLLGRDVAVKLLGGVPDEVTRERFLREARAAARLHHPNTVTVYDTGEEDDRPYIVMELVRGGSLADLLRRERQLDLDTAVAITLGVLEGLAAAHAAGMIHRDVKPANVLLPSEGGVKLSDFGIAKAVDEAAPALTATGSVLGTPTYLAPELVGGRSPSPASDVYSVGCLLYAMLAGDPPFTEGDPIAIAYAHRHDPVPPIEGHRSDLPDDLTAVLDRALTKEPEQRYTSAEDMRTALLAGPEAVPGPAAGAAATTAALPGDPTATLPGEVTAPLTDAPLTDAAAATRALDRAEPDRPAAPPAGAPATGRRWARPLTIALAVVAVALLLWWLLGGLGDGPTDLEPEPPAETDTEVDEGTDTEVTDDGTPEEAPPTEAPTDPPPADEGDTGDAPADEAPPTEEPPAEPPPGDGPPDETPPEEAPPTDEPPGDEPTDSSTGSGEGPDTPTETSTGAPTEDAGDA